MTDEEGLRERLVKSYVENDVITTKNFTLFRSGETGTDYFDIDSIVETPEGGNTLLDGVEARIGELEDGGLEYDKIAFLHKDSGPVGLLIYAWTLCQRLDAELVVLKLWKKLRFDDLKIKGNDIEDGDSVLLVDDVANTGTTQQRAIDLVRTNGGNVTGVVCVYEREDGVLNRLGEENEIEFVGSIDTNHTIRNLGLSLAEDPQEYLDEDFLTEFVEVFPGKTPDKDAIEREIDAAISELLDRHDVTASEEVRRGFRNLYFNGYVFENREEVYGIEKTD